MHGSSRPYEFDSCISTEEAFFGLEEHKFGTNFTMKQGGGSNRKEDGTPKAHRQQIEPRKTEESNILRKTPLFKRFNPNRQRTQRLSPKLTNLAASNTHGTSDDGKSSGKHQSEQGLLKKKKPRVRNLENSKEAVSPIRKQSSNNSLLEDSSFYFDLKDSFALKH